MGESLLQLSVRHVLHEPNRRRRWREKYLLVDCSSGRRTDLRRTRKRGSSPVPVQDWPRKPEIRQAFAHRQGEWAHLQARRSGLHQEQLDRIDRDRSIHPAVLPQAGDFVIATGDQLHRLCRERGILYLIYVGFATNICVPDRDYGMRAMRERGYALVLVRDATTGVEASDTYPILAATSVMIHQFELRDIAGTITSDAFLAAVGALETAPPVQVRP